MRKDSNGSHKLLSTENANFSDIEIRIIQLICREFTTEEIAQATGRSKRSINKYRQKLLIKTGSTNAIGILKYAIRHQIFLND
ncbi:MAG: hypothetical protein MI921_19185 [Cytophagales bacterium]|nr:hypothetical protein [Cytophagales bacterium]